MKSKSIIKTTFGKFYKICYRNRSIIVIKLNFHCSFFRYYFSFCHTIYFVGEVRRFFINWGNLNMYVFIFQVCQPWNHMKYLFHYYHIKSLYLIQHLFSDHLKHKAFLVI